MTYNFEQMQVKNHTGISCVEKSRIVSGNCLIRFFPYLYMYTYVKCRENQIRRDYFLFRCRTIQEKTVNLF